MSDWVDRYKARKSGRPPQVVPQQTQVPYQPQPVYYQPVPPSYGYGQPGALGQPPQPQPMPGAPAHAPFGYDPATGVPVAPYGRDQYGNVIVQPVWDPSPPQPQQTGFDPRGMPLPNGYGQPPYGQVGQAPLVRPEDTIYVGTDGQTHIDWSQGPKAYQGGQGNRESTACPNPGCKGFLIGTSGHGGGMPDGMPQSAGVFNSQTGQTVFPAPHCSSCGYIGRADGGFSPGGSTGAIVGAGVKTTGPPRLAPGAGSTDQVAHQHGLDNIFAPR